MKEVYYVNCGGNQCIFSSLQKCFDYIEFSRKIGNIQKDEEIHINPLIIDQEIFSEYLTKPDGFDDEGQPFYFLITETEKEK